MYPAYKYMDPYYHPHHRDHFRSPYNQYANWETRPPQMRVDHSSPASPFGPWPYNSSPAEFNDCCSHDYPTGFYSYRPPYPHYPPPPQVYYHGPYPPYAESYPAYFVPPPHYSVKQAQYDYDKGKGHCCGCPNHVCHSRDSNNVKIEEQKPETEQSSNSQNIDLIRLPNYSHPVVWIPPNYLKDKESNKASEAQPENRTRWVPLDMNSLKGVKQGGDDKGHLMSAQKATPFSWPIIWVPGYDKQDDAVKDLRSTNVDPKNSEDVPSPKIKIIPLNFGENENNVDQPAPKKDKVGAREHPEAVTEKEVNGKTIPVVEMRESDEKELSLDGKRKANISEKKADNGADFFCSKQSSPVRSSKLPPVCLRVDPLPKKKSANGSSRSPSPPSHKEKESAQKEKEQIQSENVPKEKIHKTVPVVFVKCVPEKNAEEISGEKHGEKSKDDSKPVERKAFEESKLQKEKQVVEENKECKEKIKGGKAEERKRQRDFSETEAATLIQSAYRGYGVRKWQPLQKLRKIKRVQEQVGEVRKRIESLRASSEMDAKQRMIIGETIMNLLLQLDTIQGLHPSVREARKSVAKELIGLQEKLDSLSQQSTMADEFVKVEERSINKEAEEQASLATSEQACGEGSDKNLVASFTDTMQCKHEEISEEGEAKESASEESMEVKDDIAFTSPSGYKDAPDDAPSLESEFAIEVPSISVNECTKPPASLVAEAEEAVSAPREAPAEIEGACSVKMPASASVAGEDKKPDEVKEKTLDELSVAVENKEEAEDSNLASAGTIMKELHLVQQGSLGKSSINSSGSGNVQAVAVSQETECAADVVASAVPSTEENVTNSDVSAPLTQNIEADAKQEELETAQFTGENTFNSQAAAPVAQSIEVDAKREELETAQFAGENASTSQSAAPVAQNIEVDNKQEELEPQTLPSVEESSITENASEVKAVDEYYSTAPLAHPVTEDLGTSTEPKKDLEMHLIQRDFTLGQDLALLCDGDHNSGENLENVSEMSKTIGANFNESVEQRQEDACYDGPTSQPPIAAPLKGEDTRDLKEVGAELTAEILSTPAVSSIPTVNLSNEEKLMEENEKLREMLQKLLDSGIEHLAVISNLGNRVKDLERKLAKNKRVKVIVNKPKRSSHNRVACH